MLSFQAWLVSVSGEMGAGPAAPLSSGKDKGKEMAVQKVSMSIQNEEVCAPPLGQLSHVLSVIVICHSFIMHCRIDKASMFLPAILHSIHKFSGYLAAVWWLGVADRFGAEDNASVSGVTPPPPPPPP